MRRSMIDWLDQFKEEGRRVELYFKQDEGPSIYYLAEVLEVGNDFVHFNAYDEDGSISARNIMPLWRLCGITLISTEMVREQLINMTGGEA